MCTMMRAYSQFWETASGEAERLSYREVCRSVGVSPVDMDECLMGELGMNGEELTEILRGLSIEEVRKPHEILHPEPFGPQVE